MKTPAIPADEDARLEALRGLDVLDSPPEERFDRFTRLAKRLFGVPIALVSLVDADRQWFKSAEGLDATETSRDISFCGHSILGDDVFVVEDAKEDERFIDNPLVTCAPNIRFYAGFPLPGPNGHRMGTLCIIDREPRTLDADDLDALRDIGSLVANELCAVQLATIDSLTGLSNRRGFTRLARQALAAARRANQPVAALMIDMDDFKPINDEYGHEEGDRALVDFANVLLDAFRESDVVARLGGDEFCVLLTGTNQAAAQITIDRLSDALAAHNRTAGRLYTLAFSAGVGGGQNGQECPDELLREADAQMYQNKRAKGGRRGVA